MMITEIIKVVVDEPYSIADGSSPSIIIFDDLDIRLMSNAHTRKIKSLLKSINDSVQIPRRQEEHHSQTDYSSIFSYDVDNDDINNN